MKWVNECYELKFSNHDLNTWHAFYFPQFTFSLIFSAFLLGSCKYYKFKHDINGIPLRRTSLSIILQMTNNSLKRCKKSN